MILTKAAPTPIGIYSQAIHCGDTVYISGQLGLHPDTGELSPEFATQCHQIFKNVNVICAEIGANLRDIVKLTVFLTNIEQADQLNDIMEQYFSSAYPARSVVVVSALPKAASVEIDVIIYSPLMG